MALGEFQMIDRLLKPLAAGCPGALGLTDDAALLEQLPGTELVLAKDAIVELRKTLYGILAEGTEGAEAPESDRR